jgi:uncharacterized membrane protein YraQ (UPF0718 family)
VAETFPLGTPRGGRRQVLLALLFATLFIAAFAWAKWDPYSHKIPSLAQSRSMGPSVLDGIAPGVSLRGGWDFLHDYVLGVWPAIVAGLVVAAGLQTLVPRRWLLRYFADAPGRSSTLCAARAAAAGLPMMLCTCCSAPVTVGLRRSRVPVRSALAYWLATPLLNPAVMVFAALALSPAWMGLRLGLGVLLVFAATWLATRGRDDAGAADAVAGPMPAPEAPAGVRAFFAALARLSIRLLPEYLVLVFVLGAVRGLLFPLGQNLASWGIGGALVLAVAGMLLVIPTGAEVAVVAALLAAGAPAWLAAALLVTLPAVSVPSLAMVASSFPRRVLVVVPSVVVAAGLVGSGVALALPL